MNERKFTGKQKSDVRLDMAKSQLFFIVLYPDDKEVNIDEALDNICANSVKYAYILHDKDLLKNDEDKHILKKAHIHLFCKMPNQMSRKAFAEKFHLHPHLVQYAISEASCIQYLRHMNERADNDEIPFQYSADEIISNYDLSKFWESNTEKEGKYISEFVNVAEEYCAQYGTRCPFPYLFRYAQEQDESKRHDMIAVLAKRTYFFKTLLNEMWAMRFEDTPINWVHMVDR